MANDVSSFAVPLFQTGPTACITNFAGKLKAGVIFAQPVLQPLSVIQNSLNSGPAALCIAPSTPPPPVKELLAAFTIASICKVIMSVFMISIFIVSQFFVQLLHHSIQSPLHTEHLLLQFYWLKLFRVLFLQNQ